MLYRPTRSLIINALLSLSFGVNVINFTFASSTKKESESFNNVTALNEDSHLQNLINTDAELKTHYSSCLQTGGDWTSCLWEKVKNNSTLKKKVQTAAEEDRKNASIIKVSDDKNNSEKNQGRSPASSDKKNVNNIVAKDNTVKIDTAKDPFIIKLQENIEKQLDTIFTTTPSETFKDSNGQVINQAASRTFLATDHSKFASLYNTHLSNSIVQSMSTFCSEAEYNKDEKKFYIYASAEKRKESLKKNIAFLKDAKLSPAPPEYKKYCVDESTINSTECAKYNPCESSSKYYDETSCRFNGCIPVVSKLCYNVDTHTPRDGIESEDRDYTKVRACEVMEFVKSARATIMALDNQEKFYKEHTEKNANGINLKGLKQFQSEGEISRNSQDIVTITSNIAKQADEASKEDIEGIKCLDNDGNITNQSACDKLVIANKEKASSAVAELNLRRQLQLEKIKELTTVDQLKEFLMAEGETKESADAYIEKISKENPGDRSIEEILQEKIISKYKAETEAIVQGLAKKISDQSIDTKDNKDQKAEKYKKIQDELKAKGARYTNMLHFGNIVSAYLTLTDSKTGKSSANANQLYRELASRKDLADVQNIEENAQKAGLSASKEDTSATTLDIKLINDEILQKNNDP